MKRFTMRGLKTVRYVRKRCLKEVSRADTPARARRRQQVLRRRRGAARRLELTAHEAHVLVGDPCTFDASNVDKFDF
jgi:hypothetical protein